MFALWRFNFIFGKLCLNWSHFFSLCLLQIHFGFFFWVPTSNLFWELFFWTNPLWIVFSDLQFGRFLGANWRTSILDFVFDSKPILDFILNFRVQTRFGFSFCVQIPFGLNVLSSNTFCIFLGGSSSNTFWILSVGSIPFGIFSKFKKHVWNQCSEFLTHLYRIFNFWVQIHLGILVLSSNLFGFYFWVRIYFGFKYNLESVFGSNLVQTDVGFYFRV